MCNPNTFVSCIKVKGINLLPPVITPKLRAELAHDKQQAIKLEKRLKQSKKLKKNLDEFSSIHIRPQSAITFEDSSHIDDLGITSARSTGQVKKQVNLSKDIVEVMEYGNDGVKMIENLPVYDTDASSITTCEIGASMSTSSRDSFSMLDLSKLSDNSEAQIPSSRKSPRGRLLRSNSYTLEAPSPILLAHLEKCSKTRIEDVEEPVLFKTWTSLENNYIPFEQSEFSSLNTVYNFADKPEAYQKPAEIEEPEKDSNKDLSPTIEVIQTDISLQQITLNPNTDRIETIKTTFDLNDPDSRLMQVLKKIPDVYSKQIIELIEKQKLEHLEKVDNFSKQFSCSTPLRDDDNSTISASPSQSMYYSVSSSDTVMPVSPWVKITDLEICEEEADNFRDKKGLREIHSQNNEVRNKLFNTNYRNIDDIKKEWAACVIGAHVRGYLTRRLLKTKRVQSLITTIKDALICALQLHTIENIDEADVKLHRRLINQVSAACCAFHDIFFGLSIMEKMSIISADRKRRMEKSTRSRSSVRLSTPGVDSSRSSTLSLTKI